MNINSTTTGSVDRIPAAVRAVLFDAVGTLLRPAPPVAAAYHAAGRRYGSRLSEQEIHSRFRSAFVRQEAIDVQSGSGVTSEARERARWREIVAEVFDDIASHEELFLVLWEHFAQPENWSLFADVPDAVRRLEERGLAWGIASNFDGRLARLCAGMAPLDRCRRLFASSDLGFRKPSREFFACIERELQLRPDELLLVGDDLANDYAAARSAGWHAVLVAREVRTESEATQTIAGLNGLI